MTITMALQDGNVMLMACDSAATDDTFELATRKGCSKAWVQHVEGVGKVLVGFSGNYASGLWIRHGFAWPFKPHTESLESFLVKSVQPHLQRSFHKRFPSETDENRVQWEILVATPSQLFKVRSCGDVEACSGSFACIGDGAQVAQGALHACAHTLSSWEALEAAFSACKTFRASVHGPLHILALGREDIFHRV
jgi:ATP-dependent protease HslVU (ClpYQ) peptidase subunit